MKEKKYDRKKHIKEAEKECDTCRNSFIVWLSSLNFEPEKEEEIKAHFLNHCPKCRLVDKVKGVEM
ncbi:MAG: hypothetical protein PHI53_02005 [Candidatus Pacebacteria bacterium]|nr:hypothetical protein [Candidatus Paceibacterota bacterium]